MIRMGRGTTRTVLILGPVTIKFARGALGRACNQYEARIWKLNCSHPDRGPHLCPVLWSSRGGRLLVMATASSLPSGVIPSDDWWDYDPAKGAIDQWPGEPKAADWG